MVGYGILMIVFGVMVMLCGIYLSCGHKSELLLWKSNVKYMSTSDVKYAGKVTIATSLAPIISGILAFFYSEDSIIPVIVLFASIILFLALAIKIFK